MRLCGKLVLTNSIQAKPKPKLPTPLVQTTNTYTAGVPFFEVGLGGDG